MKSDIENILREEIGAGYIPESDSAVIFGISAATEKIEAEMKRQNLEIIQILEKLVGEADEIPPNERWTALDRCIENAKDFLEKNR